MYKVKKPESVVRDEKGRKEEYSFRPFVLNYENKL